MSGSDLLLKILQINDTLFPTGGFAYSDGLETAVTNRLVCESATFERWLRQYIELVFVPCEGLAVKLAMHAGEEALQKLDEELTAIKPAASARAASTTVGRGFLKAVSTLHQIPTRSIENLPVVYGVACRHFRVETEDALSAFAYNRLAATTSAALRVMSIGQQQAHGALTQVLKDVPAAVNQIMNNSDTHITSFAPMLDIQQMNHRYLYSRLFRS
jgi:urease accessory protein